MLTPQNFTDTGYQYVVDNFLECYRRVRSAYYSSSGGHYEPKSERDHQLCVKLQELESWMKNQFTPEEINTFIKT